MTDTTDIKALRPAERAKLGFVTDDSTGGYYVAECEECGQIFPSQTCDGGEQIADSGDYGDCYCPHCGFIDPLECDNANLVWNVQQLKIVNLTKLLEAERQSAAETNNINLNIKTSLHDRMVKAEKEVAALKGGLQPVGEIVAWAGTDREKGITREVDFRFLRFDVLPGTKLYAVEPAPATFQLRDPPAGVVMRQRFEKPEDCECSSIDYCESCLETTMSKPAPAVKSDLLTRAEALAVETRALASRIQAEE